MRVLHCTNPQRTRARVAISTNYSPHCHLNCKCGWGKLIPKYVVLSQEQNICVNVCSSIPDRCNMNIV